MADTSKCPQLTKLEDEVENLHRALAEAGQENMKMQEEKEDLVSQRDEAEEAAERSAREINSLLERNNQLNRERNDLRRHVSCVKQELDEAQEDAEELGVAMAKLEKRRQELVCMNEQLQAALRGRDKALEEERRRAVQDTVAKNEWMERAGERLQEISSLKKQLQAAEQRIDELVQATPSQEMQKVIDELRSRLELQIEAASKLTEQRDSWKRQVTNWKEKVAEVREFYQGRVAHLHVELEQARSNPADARVAELNNILLNQQHANARLRNERNQAQHLAQQRLTDKKALLAMLEERDNALRQMEQRLASYQTGVTKLTEELRKGVAENGA